MMNKHLKFAYAANNLNGLLCAQVIKEKGYEPEILILHPHENAQYGDELSSVFSDVPVWEWDKGSVNDLICQFSETEIDVLLSINFGYLFPQEILSCVKWPINLHTSLMPWNRGANPNVWSLVENTPVGVTLHLMTDKVDQGSVIRQLKVEKSCTDNAKLLYGKLQDASVSLISETIDEILNGNISTQNVGGEGSFHLSSDFDKICQLNLNEKKTIKETIDLLRALTFPPYRNAYFLDSGKKVFVEIYLTAEDSQ